MLRHEDRRDASPGSDAELGIAAVVLLFALVLTVLVVPALV